MALLCFLLDLRTIPPPLLLQLKECLLQLANLYAASSRHGHEDPTDDPRPITDRIGLCYIAGGCDHQSHEMKIVYSPRVNFSLRDFHHAVSKLPMDCFLTESHDCNLSGGYCTDITLSGLLCHEGLYSWAGKNVLKKLVFVGSSLIKHTEMLQKSLSDAREQSVSVEFVLLHEDHHDALSGKFREFLNCLSDLGNVKGRRYYPETSVLHGLVKSWLRELGIGIRQTAQVVLVFKDNIFASRSQIYCNLYASINEIIDGFTPCQTCRCHGQPVTNGMKSKSKGYHCQVTHHDLEVHDLVEHVVKVGEGTLLFLSSYDCCPFTHPVTRPITLKVIERINLASLDEGIIFGMPYFVIAHACGQFGAVPHECVEPEMNCQFFKGLCGSLSFLDQGLLCSSTCNTETLKEADIECLYILQPSYRGSMLLRRIAASEEFLPLSEATLNEVLVPGEIMTYIWEYLSKMPLEDYNPLLHERGLHAKLSLAVKESLPLGAILDKHTHASTALTNIMHSDMSTRMRFSVTPSSEAETLRGNKDEDFSCTTEEWNQLPIIDEMKQSPSITKHRIPILMSESKPIDEQTSRILERLEPPKQRQYQASQAVAGTGANVNVKMPPLALSSSTSFSQRLKPTFQRSKRKQI